MRGNQRIIIAAVLVLATGALAFAGKALFAKNPPLPEMVELRVSGLG